MVRTSVRSFLVCAPRRGISSAERRISCPRHIVPQEYRAAQQPLRYFLRRADTICPYRSFLFPCPPCVREAFGNIPKAPLCKGGCQRKLTGGLSPLPVRQRSCPSAAPGRYDLPLRVVFIPLPSLCKGGFWKHPQGPLVQRGLSAKADWGIVPPTGSSTILPFCCAGQIRSAPTGRFYSLALPV